MRFSPRSEKAVRRRARIERSDAILSVVSVGVLALAAVLLMSGPKLMMVLFRVVVPAGAYLLGKAFPLLGTVLGWGLALTPVWLGAWMWKTGALAWQSGDYRPLGTILAWVFLFIMCGVGMAIGGMLLKGASHKGSWSDARAELDEHNQEVIKPLARLD